MMSRTICIAALALLLVGAGVYAQTYSDSQLLALGKQAYNANRCVSAAKFFFAYLLRNPSQGDPSRARIEQAIAWCEENTAMAAGSKGDRQGEGGIQPPPVAVLGRGRGRGFQPDVSSVGPPPAMNNDPAVQRRCDAYARVAVAQAEAFASNRCGSIDGGRWQTSYNNHFGWCAGVGAGVAQGENTERQRVLNACTP
jgi:hypothetical protein